MRLRTILGAASFAGAGMLALPTPGHAQAFVTGAQLTRACNSHAPADESACGGYIAGTLDQVAADAQLRASLCPPAGTKLSVLREALGKFGQQRPEEAKGSGTALVQAMIKTTYPCPAK